MKVSELVYDVLDRVWMRIPDGLQPITSGCGHVTRDNPIMLGNIVRPLSKEEDPILNGTEPVVLNPNNKWIIYNARLDLLEEKMDRILALLERS